MNYRGRVVDVIALWSDLGVDLKQDDGEFLPLTYCPNPEHDNSHSPAFQVNQERPLVHCFSGCGISGTYEHAICVIEGLYSKYPDDERGKRRAQREARKRVLRHTRVGGKKLPRGKDGRRTRKRGNGIPASEAADGRSYEDELRSYRYLPPFATEYLASRRISERAISHFSIGYNADQRRIIVPARDERGRTVGLIARAVRAQDHPKYLYSEGFDRNRLLFGACGIDLGLVRSNGLILVEGSFDALVLYSMGFRNVCAILGSKISRTQVEIISRMRPPRIYLMFDKDPAGIGALVSAKLALVKFPLFVCRYPKGKFDPAELTRKEASRSLERAVPMLKFVKHLPEQGVYVG